MQLKQQILSVLRKPDFPDLEFLYSPEVLNVAEDILMELLEEEKKDFQKKLKTLDTEITFDTFEEFSLLDYFFGLLEHYQWVNNDETIREIIESFEPKYIDFGNEIAYSKRYYEMLIYCLEKTFLDYEQKRIIKKSIEAYEVRGIALSKEKQDTLKKLNKELSELSQRFSNNVLDDQKSFSYLIEDEGAISDMPEDDKKVAQKRAEKKTEQWFLFDASGASYMSIMKYCRDRGVRQHFYESRNSFATKWKYNNKPIILQILCARNSKAQLLGFKNYAELSLHFKMADTSEQIIELFADISQKARPKAQAELSEIQDYFNITDLQVWDLGYYANKLRQEKYDFDEKKLKKYFEFESVLAGMFTIIDKLYGLKVKKLDIKSYHEDAQVYEVSKNGKFLSYFLTDYFHRPLKRQGAWANILREDFEGKKKFVVNVANFQKGSDGITLLTLSDVETMFHEFGHVTHEMLSTSKYSELSGFHVEWDFVELPSQLLENWCRDRAGMKLFAKHIDSGRGVPEEMLEKLEKLDTFGSGQMILTQNTYAMMDMGLHSQHIPETEKELDAYVLENHKANTLLPIPQIYSPHTSFTHIFDGGYASGYYSYMWAEIIEKEVWKVFKDSGDIFSPEISRKFHDTILSQGTTKKASELFRDFMGRGVEIDAFLSEKGLI